MQISLKLKTRISHTVVYGIALLGVVSFAHAQPPVPYVPRHHGGTSPAIVVSGSPQYVFGSRAHLVRLSDLMASQANAAALEMHNYYQGNRGFHSTYRQMYQLLQSSQHIQKLVRENYYRNSARKDDHIANDLWQMDQLFDEVEDSIRGWTSGYQGPRRAEPLRVMLNDFEATLDNLMVDYGVKSRITRRRHVGGQVVVAPPPQATVIVPPPHTKVVVPRANINIVVPRR